MTIFLLWGTLEGSDLSLWTKEGICGDQLLNDMANISPSTVHQYMATLVLKSRDILWRGGNCTARVAKRMRNKKRETDWEDKVHHVALNWEYYFSPKKKYLFSSGIQFVCSHTIRTFSDHFHKHYSRKVQMGIVRNVANGGVRRSEPGSVSLNYVPLECGVTS